MMFPTIHLNGTSSQELVASYKTALDALDHALAAVSQTYPNGRDYYPQGDNALDQASSEHLARRAKLLAVRGELEALALHCAA